MLSSRHRIFIAACIVIASAPLTAFAIHGAAADNIAAANFDDGTLGPFTAVPAGTTRIIDDPTGAGHGRVAELKYEAAKARVEPAAALTIRPPSNLSLGSTFFFSGDIYFPVTTFNWQHPRVTRMLLVFRAPLGDSLDDRTDSFLSMNLAGRCGLSMQWSNDGKLGLTTCNLAPFALGKWHHIELQVTLNSSAASRDGVIRLWVDGDVAHEDTKVRFTDPARGGSPRWRSWAVGEGRTSSDDGLGRDMSDDGTISEVRYWDNLAFTTTRLPGR